MTLLRAAFCAMGLAISWGATAEPGRPAASQAGSATRSAAGGAIPRPERTTASYGDWVLQCENPAEGVRRCEVAQSLTDGRGQLTLNAVIRPAANPTQLALVVQLGVNAIVDEPARLEVEGQPALLLAFHTCLPRGCFAEAVAARSDLGAMTRNAASARLEYHAANASPLSFTLSLRGFTTALDVLQHSEQN